MSGGVRGTQLPAELAAGLERLAAGADPAVARRLSDRYRAGDRLDAEPAVTGPAGVAAYAATRAPATYAAVAAVLDDLAARRPGWAPASLLDAGAGLGGASWAAAARWPSLAAVTSIERSPAMAAAGRHLAVAAPWPAVRDGRWVEADLAAATLPVADLVVAAYVVGELADPAGAVARLWGATAGALVVVEAGTPAGYRRVLAARSALLAAGGTVDGPCPHDRACPLATVAGEWCHFARRLPRSRRHRQAKGATLGWEDEKFSWVAVSRSGGLPAAGRILRHPRQRPGLVTLEVCGRDGAGAVPVPRSSPLWRAARDAAWGDPWPPG